MKWLKQDSKPYPFNLRLLSSSNSLLVNLRVLWHLASKNYINIQALLANDMTRKHWAKQLDLFDLYKITLRRIFNTLLTCVKTLKFFPCKNPTKSTKNSLGTLSFSLSKKYTRVLLQWFDLTVETELGHMPIGPLLKNLWDYGKALCLLMLVVGKCLLLYAKFKM